MNQKMRTAIVEWLEAERQRYASAAASLDIPSSIQQIQLVARNVRLTGAEFSRQLVDVSPLAELQVGRRLSEALEDDEGTTQLARALVEQYGERCRVFSPLVAVKFEEEPEEWIERNLLARVHSGYLAGLDSLDSPDPARADEMAAGLLQLIESDEVVFVTALPLAGIEFDDERVEHEDVGFRRLSPEELGDLADYDVGLHRPWIGRVRRAVPDFSSERWVMEVRVRHPKAEQPMSGHRPHRILLALQMLGFELHGTGHATTWTEPGPALWTGFQGFKIPLRGDTKLCSINDLRRAMRLAQGIPDEVFSGPSRPMHVALSRFQLGAADSLPEDALIDYTIALEAFLLPAVAQGEYRFKFSLFGARYLGSSPAERKELFAKLKHIYDIRSQIVHGVSPPTHEQVESTVGDARDLACRIFTKALEFDWPSPESLQEATIES